MELGKGKWENIDDLHNFRDQFIKHMDDYEMIISLRCLSSLEERKLGFWKYEMIEIPKELLLKARTGIFVMKNESRQNPKPGYCYIKENNKELFKLYFDGGSERKLQIKSLMKENCNILTRFAFKK